MNRLKGLVFLIIFGLLCILVVIQAGLKANEIVIPEDKKVEVLWDVVFKPDSEINEVVVNYTDGVEFTTPQLFDSIVNDFDVTFKKPEEEISYKFNLSFFKSIHTIALSTLGTGVKQFLLTSNNFLIS